MAYINKVQGQFYISPNLSESHLEYLKRFTELRRMKRDPIKTEKRLDIVRKSVNLPAGQEGEYYVGQYVSHYEQTSAEDVIDSNQPPITQPSLWCDWKFRKNRFFMSKGDDELFYYEHDVYIKWFHYLLDNFLHPWGYFVSGEILMVSINKFGHETEFILSSQG